MTSNRFSGLVYRRQKVGCVHIAAREGILDVVVSIVVVYAARCADGIVCCIGGFSRAREQIAVDGTNLAFLLTDNIQFTDMLMPCFTGFERRMLKLNAV